jgi:hypothetical protein
MGTGSRQEWMGSGVSRRGFIEACSAASAVPAARPTSTRNHGRPSPTAARSTSIVHVVFTSTRAAWPAPPAISTCPSTNDVPTEMPTAPMAHPAATDDEKE